MPAKQKAYEKEENPAAFKLWINKGTLTNIGREIVSVYPEFETKKLTALAPKLDPLELKARVRLVRDQLRALLPNNYPEALRILVDSTRAGKLQGFTLWPYTEFIQAFGLEHRELSLDAIREITSLFTGEFAVRPFLKKDTEATLAYLKKCASDKSEHVRRWASEGSRPRLPWGERLDIFIQRPEKTLELLELLKNDESLYVRKSVANHMNDISKDHPELVVKTLKRWNSEAEKEQGQPNFERIRWISNRALRTLIKNGNAGALAVIGISAGAKVKVRDLQLQKSKIRMGERLEISFAIESLAKGPQKLIIDYVIHFVKANKRTAPKVFKLKSLTIEKGRTLVITKSHHIKPITTRRYYPGAHALEIQINGTIHDRVVWHLL